VTSANPKFQMSLYWRCQIVGWSLYGLLAFGIPTLFGGLRWSVVARTALGIVLGLVLTHQFRRYMRRNGWLRLPLLQLAPRIVSASVVIGALIVLGVSPFLLDIFGSGNRLAAMATVLIFHIVGILLWSAIYLGHHYLRSVRAVEAAKWQLELANRDAELSALRAQLNPHFLFNSLNSLRALVTEDPARARDAITGLAALLRHTLRLSRARTIALDEELEATEHYLQLEALRFENRLHYEIDARPDALQHPVPPMLVQTLVENAIKHGIARLPEGGTISIKARDLDGNLCIRVTNTGTLTNGAISGGIGIRNAFERLRLTFGDGVRLDVQPSGPMEVTCTVLVPAANFRRARKSTSERDF
jgi:hypothetical protein